jgi:PAS domain S-box-containing protein
MAQERSERELAAVRLAVDYAIVHILAEEASLSDAAPRIIACIGETLGWQVGGLWEIERKPHGMLRAVSVWQAEGIDAAGFAEQTRSIELAPGVGVPGRIYASGKPLWIPDVTREPNFPRAHEATKAGLHAAFAFPISGANEILGVIELFAREAREPDPALFEMVAVVGSQVGQFMERKFAEQEIKGSEELKTAMLEAAFDCVIAMDHEGNVLEFNPAAEQAFGYTREDVIGKELAELVIPPHLRDRHRRGLERMLAGGDAPVLGRRIELTGMRSDGAEFPIELAVTRIGTEDPPKFTGSIRDITERRRSEQALRFLVEASASLDASLDLDTTLETIARLCVPYLADACMVDLIEEDGTIRRAAGAAADRSYEPVVQELQRHSIDPAGTHPIARVMRTGRTEIVHDVSESFRSEIAETEAYYEALSRWPARSVVVAPLRSRGKVLGTVALASFTPERAYGLEQIAVIEEVASRAAKTVENALLYRDRARIARGLEQSLLPPQLPVVPGFELAARFQPAEGGGKVGGDFYDVFDTGRGDWAIVMGDVAGRGVEAAAVTVLARHTIRAAAMQQRAPSEVLAALNDALRVEMSDFSFCSAIVGRLTRDDSGATLSLASGGHPLPLLLRPSGEVTSVGRTGTLLGVVSEPELRDDQVQLGRGDTLIFYTNGVAEFRMNGARFNVEELTRLVATCNKMDAIETADCIDEAVQEANPAGQPDDAAILVAKRADSG